MTLISGIFFYNLINTNFKTKHLLEAFYELKIKVLKQLKDIKK